MNLDERVAYIKGNPIRNSSQMSTAIVTKPIDEEWDKNIRNRPWYHTSPESAYEQKGQFQLRNILLTFGGSEVCMPFKDPDIEEILSRGQLWYGDRTKKVRGEPCHCHYNSARQWNRNPEEIVLCTGYALSEDGMWRQHSWCVEPRKQKSRIIETTVERVAYFGYAMTIAEAEKFYENICY